MFWGLGKKLARRKDFPSVNWSISHSKYIGALEAFFEAEEPDFVAVQRSESFTARADGAEWRRISISARSSGRTRDGVMPRIS